MFPEFVRLVYELCEHVGLATASIQLWLRRLGHVWIRILNLYVQLSVNVKFAVMWVLVSCVERRRRPILLLHLFVYLATEGLEVDVIAGLRLPDHRVNLAIDINLQSIQLLPKV